MFGALRCIDENLIQIWSWENLQFLNEVAPNCGGQYRAYIEPNQIEATLATRDMLWSEVQPYLPPEGISRVEPVRNIDHVFHGHTIVENYRAITNRTFMGLRSYDSGRIGLIDPLIFLSEEK